MLLQAKLEDSEAQVRELSRQVMALERAKLELEARNRQLETRCAAPQGARPGAAAAGRVRHAHLRLQPSMKHLLPLSSHYTA